MAVKSTVQTAYLSCLINRFTFRPKPRTRTPFQLIDHVDHDDGCSPRAFAASHVSLSAGGASSTDVATKPSASSKPTRYKTAENKNQRTGREIELDRGVASDTVGCRQ